MKKNCLPMLLWCAGCLLSRPADSHAQCNGIAISNPSSLIPNPYFESRYCCPEDVTGPGTTMDCLNDHIQASTATTDYHVVDCGGSLGNPYVTYIPSGTPSGNGMLGVLNEDGWKEYLGTCLTGTLNPGTQYTLKFKLGFGTSKGPHEANGEIYLSDSYSPVTFALFGGACSGLPFPGSGCPGFGWTLLGSVTLTGYDEWVEGTINFTVSSQMNAVVFGPDCSPTNGLSGYYYLDDMLLNETNAFNPQLNINAAGHPCSGLTLSVDNYSGFGYQWFYNGNPIAGATSYSYQVPLGQEGNYFVRMYHAGQCVESNGFTYTVPVLETVLDEEVCFGETVQVGSTVFDASGDYTVPLTSFHGCDSIVYLSLIVREQLTPEEIVAHPILCAGGTTEVTMTSNADSPQYQWSDGTAAAKRGLPAGSYEVFVRDGFGCESDPVAFVLSEPDSLKVTLTLTHETCVGYEDGTMLPRPEGGIPPYEVQFQAEVFLPWHDSLKFAPLAPLEYGIVIRDSNLCLLDASFIILPREPVHVFIEPVGRVAIGDSAALVLKTEPPIDLETYRWQGNFLSCDTCALPVFHPQTLPWNQFGVQLTERIVGCPYDAHLTVEITDGVFIPNVFAPDEDGWNDAFFIRSNPNSVEEVDEFFVQDRWGELMFYGKSFPPNNENYGWDGNFRGKEMPPGVYVYFAKISLSNTRQVIKKGTVTLLR